MLSQSPRNKKRTMNRTTRIRLASAALLSIGAGPALAADPGFYLSASLGHAKENPGKSVGINIGIGFGPLPSGIQHIDPTRVDVDDSSLSGSVGVGYRINPNVAVEVEYIDFGTANISEHNTLSTPIIPFLPVELTRPYTSRVKGPALSVLGSLPIGKGWDVFARGGALFADREIRVNQTIGLNGTTFGSTVWLAGAGVNWSVASRCALRAEYQRTGKLDSSFLAGGTELERLSLSVLFKL
jgi:hypothetical protein